MQWQPTLGDIFSKKLEETGAARRFEEAGFDLQQSPGRSGDKSHGRQAHEGIISMETPSSQPTASQPNAIPPHIQQQIDAMRDAGATVGIPLVVQLDDRALKALVTKSAPISQDLARFSAKAAIGATLGLGAALAFWLITKPTTEL